MNHRRASQLLPWYVNDTLPEGEDLEVAAHIEECKKCRREVDKLQELERLVEQDCLQQLPPPAETWRAKLERNGLPPVIGEIRPSDENESEMPIEVDPPRTPFGPAAAVQGFWADWKYRLAQPLAACVALLIGILLFQNLYVIPRLKHQSGSSIPFTLKPPTRGVQEIAMDPAMDYLVLKMEDLGDSSRFWCELYREHEDSSEAVFKKSISAPKPGDSALEPGELMITIAAAALQPGRYTLVVSQQPPNPEQERQLVQKYRFRPIWK